MVRKDFTINDNLTRAIRGLFLDDIGNGRFQTRATYGTKFKMFVPYLERAGVGNLEEVRQKCFDDAAALLALDVAQGVYQISTGHNMLSTANRVFEAMGLHVKVSPTRFLGRRTYIRTEVPSGLEPETVDGCLDSLRQQELLRPLAMVRMCRNLGLRAREAVLADTVRMLEEAASRGEVNVQEGTKGGRKEARWIPATPTVVAALQFARDQSPPGSRNLLNAGETYIRFVRGEMMRARPILKVHGIRHYRDLRAACFCARYLEITGRPAPVIAGKNPDRQADAIARIIISAEAGHNRIDVAGAYVGGRR